jgi:hypothetical protein
VLIPRAAWCIWSEARACLNRLAVPCIAVALHAVGQQALAACVATGEHNSSAMRGHFVEGMIMWDGGVCRGLQQKKRWI